MMAGPLDSLRTWKLKTRIQARNYNIKTRLGRLHFAARDLPDCNTSRWDRPEATRRCLRDRWRARQNHGYRKDWQSLSLAARKNQRMNSPLSNWNELTFPINNLSRNIHGCSGYVIKPTRLSLSSVIHRSLKNSSSVRHKHRLTNSVWLKVVEHDDIGIGTQRLLELRLIFNFFNPK